jgi:exopolyphosphatase/guanosine-5'-triphosphate,3'-diphosphate pyrophosphatase
MASTGLLEMPRERRLRHAACLLADTSWRAHPDYRGEQSMNITAHAAFVGIDHPGRAFLALTMFFRHTGLSEDDLSPRLRELSTARMLDRARILGAAMRVAYLISAGQGRLLPHMPMRVERGRLTLRLPRRFRALSSDRVFNRLNQLARLIGRDAAIVT